ncbi:fimbria/pilus outer membrane usher protein [Acinetobacter sp. MB5]|uniref:fimbria/pilus outer membrane usher protein n=1 Tax=Acinetobacter sp. MB5 TaxID=2069438 RepID=UPI000DD00E84|nr:fimbria/pilus outer membrane usher protein [Acinetobacter sp. MB5]
MKKMIMIINGLVICSFVHAGGGVDNEQVLVDVWLNGVDRNVETVLLKDNNQLYVECSVLNELEVKMEFFQNHPSQKQYCLVSSSSVTSELDMGLQAVKINVPPEYFSGFLTKGKLSVPNKASFGGFLNYDFYFDKSTNSHSFNNLYELGFFKDYWMFKNSVIYRDQVNSGEESVVRLNTEFSLDFPENYTRLILGDTTTVYNPLASSFRFGGVSFGTNYNERSDFIYWNSPILRGSAVVPSIVDLYINGTRIYRQNVTPGDYVLQTGANIQESGNAQIVVQDVLGNRSVQNFPILINNRLLQTGLNDYNISIGKIRYNYDYNSSDYREFFSSVYFRRGITDKTTLGFTAEYSSDIQTAGLMWTQAAPKFALFDFSAMGSHGHGENGYAFGASVSRTFQKFSFGLSSRYSSKKFQSLGYTDSTSIPEFDNLAYLSFYNIPFFDSVNLNYIDRRYYKDAVYGSPNTKLLNVSVSKTITPRISLMLTYFKDFGDIPKDGAYLALRFNLDNKAVYFNQSVDGDTRIDFSRTSSEQNGFDYSVGANRSNGEMGYNASGMLRTSYGDLRVLYNQDQKYYDTQLDYKGALVWLDNQFNFTKAVDNAFALVKVSDYKDIEVYRSLVPVGKTKKNGYFFIHDILPYITYDLSFNQDQIPIESKLEGSTKKLIALDQRGYFFDFPIYQTKQVVVKLLNTKNEILPRATEVYLDDNQDEIYPVDVVGNVYLYGLLPNHQYHLKAKIGEDSYCTSELDVPAQTKESSDSEKPLELICK